MRAVPALALLGVLALALPAAAWIPCPEFCITEASVSGDNPPQCTAVERVVASPAGNAGCITVHVELIDCYGMPVTDARVEAVPHSVSGEFFCSCTEMKSEWVDEFGMCDVVFCCLGGNGEVEFEVTGYKGEISVPLLPTNTVELVSYDIDGDCVVSIPDLARWVMMRGTSNPAGDYDCSGDMGLADLSRWTAHRLDSCSECPD